MRDTTTEGNTCTIKGSEKHSQYHGIIIIITSSFVRSFIKSKEKSQGGLGLTPQQNLSEKVSSLLGAGGKCILQRSNYYRNIYPGVKATKARPRMNGAMPQRIITTFHYTPFFPFRFFPAGSKPFQTGVSAASVANFVHIRHLHAFLRRYNTTTTWFESEAVGKPLQDRGKIRWMELATRGHRKLVWVATILVTGAKFSVSFVLCFFVFFQLPMVLDLSF